ANGGAVNDGAYMRQAGFRADWDRSAGQLTLQGDAYSGHEQQPAPGMFTINGISRLNPISISGVNVLGRWERRLDGGSHVTVLAYYDRTERNVPGTLDDTLDVLDVQFQYSLSLTAAQSVAWGAEYRYGQDRVVNDDFIAFLPAAADRAWTSLFAQDEITIRDDLRVIL